ncbi:MAG: winged helix-turn-helix domain-containing protein [Acidobacteria bacterium]|nr:winged helix-turn-helix domain-containing protein [Acidobacteriota bacterium]
MTRARPLTGRASSSPLTAPRSTLHSTAPGGSVGTARRVSSSSSLHSPRASNLLGTAPETLSRILARMAREGPIEEPRPRAIRILDRAALEQLADGRRRLA